MNRYEILLNKKPDEKEKEELVYTFGFDNNNISILHPHEFFRINIGETKTIALIGTDSEKLFICTLVHYDLKKRFYFLCQNDICCEIPNRWPKSLRINCLVCDFQNYIKDSKKFRILPWNFGLKVWSDLKRINEEFSLLGHNLVITRKSKFEYDYVPIPKSTELEERSIQDQISFLSNNRKKYLGKDLTVKQIRELL